MGIYINNKIILEKEKVKANELEKAMIMLQLAQKEEELEDIKTENAYIMLELANLKEAK